MCLRDKPEGLLSSGKVNNAALRHAPNGIDSPWTSDGRVDCLLGPTFESVRHDDADDPTRNALAAAAGAQSQRYCPLARVALSVAFGAWPRLGRGSRGCSFDVVRC